MARLTEDGRLIIDGDAGVIECTTDNKIILYMSEDDELAKNSDAQFRAFAIYYLMATSPDFADILDDMVEDFDIWNKYLEFLENGRDIYALMEKYVDGFKENPKSRFKVIDGGLTAVNQE